MVFCNLSICLAQGNDFAKEGRVISKGNNTIPVGELKVTTYRLEVIKLTKPLDKKDSKPPIETAFRIIILTDEPLPEGGNYNIWIDDVEYQAYQIQPNEVAMLKYARTLPNGVSLALSKWGERDLTARSVLLEKLNVPDKYATSSQEIEENRPVIRLRRLTIGSRQLVEIRVESPQLQCSIAVNVPTVLEIDCKDFGGGCSHWFSNEEFAQLRDGAEIIIKRGFGRDATNRRVVGRLDKSRLEQ